MRNKEEKVEEEDEEEGNIPDCDLFDMFCIHYFITYVSCSSYTKSIKCPVTQMNLMIEVRLCETVSLVPTRRHQDNHPIRQKPGYF